MWVPLRGGGGGVVWTTHVYRSNIIPSVDVHNTLCVPLHLKYIVYILKHNILTICQWTCKHYISTAVTEETAVIVTVASQVRVTQTRRLIRQLAAILVSLLHTSYNDSCVNQQSSCRFPHTLVSTYMAHGHKDTQ